MTKAVSHLHIIYRNFTFLELFVKEKTISKKRLGSVKSLIRLIKKLIKLGGTTKNSISSYVRRRGVFLLQERIGANSTLKERKVSKNERTN